MNHRLPPPLSSLVSPRWTAWNEYWTLASSSYRTLRRSTTGDGAMIRQPYVRHLDDAPWDTRPGRTDGVRCELLIDADRTLSHGFSPGVLEFPTGMAWAHQHHDPPRVYLIRESEAEYPINRQKIGPNTIIYNPKT